MKRPLRKTGLTIVLGIMIVALGAGVPRPASGQEWEVVTELPQARAGAAAVEIGGSIYVIGGRGHRERATATVFRYHPGTNEWDDDVAPMRRARVNAAAVVLANKILVIGGRSHEGEVLQSVEVYSPDSNEWAEFPDTKRQREGAAAILLRGQMFLIGGSDQSERVLETVEVFDVENDRWEEISAWRLDRPRVSAAAAVLDGSVYIFGGFNTFGPVGDLQRYNATTTALSSSDMPVARGALAAVTIGRSIYVIGGRSQEQVLRTTQIFHPDDSSWAPAAPLHTARFSFAAARSGLSIYVFGGLGDQGMPLASVEKLGPISIASEDVGLPPDFALESPFPNPFRQNTRVEYSVSSSRPGLVTVDVIDVTGRVVRTLVSTMQPPGRHQLSWDGENERGATVASGLYLIRMRQGPLSIIRKVVRVAG